jgi:hypothetical protein
MIRSRNQARTAKEQTESNQETATPKQHALSFLKNITRRPLYGFRTPPSDHSLRSTGTEATDIDKSVAFATHGTVYHTIARRDFSSEELKAAWFSKDEYLQISKQCSKQIHKMDQGEILKDKKYCARGLEAHTRMGSITRSKSRAQSIRAVLQEQDVLISKGFFDEEAIGFVYHGVTSSCQMWAIVIGYRDEQAAEAYMEDEEIQVLAQAGVARREPCTRIECPPTSILRRNRIIISARSA